MVVRHELVAVPLRGCDVEDASFQAFLKKTRGRCRLGLLIPAVSGSAVIRR